MTITVQHRKIFPDEKEMRAALESSRQLAAFLSTGLETQSIALVDEAQTSEAIEIPARALHLLGEILNELAAGNTVEVVSIHADVTAQEAANMLNISRTHLARLLNQGALPHTGAGRHRKIKLADLTAYKQQLDEASHSAMDELATQAQALGMGYR